jgi:hypothetical protein
MGKIFEIIDILKTSYRVMFENLSIIWPLVVYIMVTGMFLTPQLAFKPVIMIFMLLLSAAFIAGWYPVISKNISLFFIKAFTKEEKALEYVKNYKEFFPGVEKNILSMISLVCLSFVFIFVAVGIALAISKILFSGVHFEQTLRAFDREISNAKTNSALSNIVKSQKYNSVYYMMIIASTLLIIYSYLTMFWTQAVILYSKNPLKALLECLSVSFKKPIETVLIFLVNFTANLIILGMGLIAGQNSLFQIFSLLATIYITVYLTILNFISFEKFSQKVNSYHRSDCVR